MAASTYPQTLEGMKEDIRSYMRRYGQMHSDDLLEDFKLGWPAMFEQYMPLAMGELVHEGFLVLQGSATQFIATLANPSDREQ